MTHWSKKPFGRSCEHSRQLQGDIEPHQRAEKIFCRDHYLKKEVVNNVHLENNILSADWDYNQVDGVEASFQIFISLYATTIIQLIVAQDDGIEG